jgi:hypothetical protein
MCWPPHKHERSSWLTLTTPTHEVVHRRDPCFRITISAGDRSPSRVQRAHNPQFLDISSWTHIQRIRRLNSKCSAERSKEERRRLITFSYYVATKRPRREWSRWESSDIDEARRVVSERERANQSKPNLQHLPGCLTLT